MVEIDILYEGELRCAAVHAPSGMRLVTDAPVDNHGKGESFSPTDLVATALGTCLLTIMGITAQKLNIDLRGTKVTVQKEMAANPRRIARLAATIEVETPLNEEQKKQLKDAALTCPVHKSLHPDVQVPIEFKWA